MGDGLKHASPADALAPILASSVAPWLRDAIRLIDRKLDDAQAHASKALTAALKDAPDGRPTLSKARNSKSYAAALNRMGELRDLLVALVREARGAFYAESFAFQRGQVPDSLHVTPEPEPTRANAARFVAAVLHGADLYSEIAFPVGASSRRLLAAVTLAGRRGAGEAQRVDTLKAWRVREGRAILQAARSALTDSRVAAMTVALRDVVHDDYIDDTPLAIGD